MNAFFSQLIEQPHLLAFALAWARIAALLWTAPAVSPSVESWRIRALLATVGALFVTPLHGASPPAVRLPAEVLLLLSREVVLGASMGLSMLIFASAFQAIGRLLGRMSGWGFSAAEDPAAAPLARFYDLTAMALFFSTGGHRQAVAGLLETFAWMPPGRAGFSGGWIDMLLELTGHSFLLCLRAAAPALAAIWAATLLLGWLERAWPQSGALSWGTSLNSVTALALAALSLGGAAWLFQDHAELAWLQLQKSFYAAASVEN